MWYLLNLHVLGKHVDLFQNDIKSKPGNSTAVGAAICRCNIRLEFCKSVYASCCLVGRGMDLN